ncbi:hypothetical protein EHS25_008330 [Saitozyma podzolica]|uniref:Uncharacterized protein n=1 Tax=Saitozyma podzolica TaxID=1890683 RepID=A0A427YP45_9TREE|nr:hypothetical protein EHS25_008330 [Saitozyma podzolica]
MLAVPCPTCESQHVSPRPTSSDVSQPDLHNTEHEDSALDLSTPGSQSGGDDVFSLSPTPASTWSSISSTEDPVVRDYLSSHTTSAPSVESDSVSELPRSHRLCGFNSKRPYSSTCEPCSEHRYEHDKFTGMIICRSHLDTMQRLSKGDAAVEKLLSGFKGAPRRGWGAEPSSGDRTQKADGACPSTVEDVSIASSDTVRVL